MFVRAIAVLYVRFRSGGTQKRPNDNPPWQKTPLDSIESDIYNLRNRTVVHHVAAFSRSVVCVDSGRLSTGTAEVRLYTPDWFQACFDLAVYALNHHYKIIDPEKFNPDHEASAKSFTATGQRRSTNLGATVPGLVKSAGNAELYATILSLQAIVSDLQRAHIAHTMSLEALKDLELEENHDSLKQDACMLMVVSALDVLCSLCRCTSSGSRTSTLTTNKLAHLPEIRRDAAHGRGADCAMCFIPRSRSSEYAMPWRTADEREFWCDFLSDIISELLFDQQSKLNQHRSDPNTLQPQLETTETLSILPIPELLSEPRGAIHIVAAIEESSEEDDVQPSLFDSTCNGY